MDPSHLSTRNWCTARKRGRTGWCGSRCRRGRGGRISGSWRFLRTGKEEAMTNLLLSAIVLAAILIPAGCAARLVVLRKKHNSWIEAVRHSSAQDLVWLIIVACAASGSIIGSFVGIVFASTGSPPEGTPPEGLALLTFIGGLVTATVTVTGFMREALRTPRETK